VYSNSLVNLQVKKSADTSYMSMGGEKNLDGVSHRLRGGD